MEPVSLAASILTLVSAASTTGQMLTRLWGLQGSPDYMVTAINEVTDFKALLKVVHSTVKDAEDTIPENIKLEFERLLGRAQSQLDNFGDFLQHKLLRDRSLGTPGELKLKRSAKVREVLGNNQNRVDTLRHELISIKIGLSATLGTLNASYLQSMPRLLMGIQEIPLGQRDKTPPSSPLTPFSEKSTTIAQVVSIAQPFVTPALTGPLIFGRDRSSSDSGSYVMVRTKEIQRQYPHSCPCQCHIPFQGTTPRWLRGLVGIMFFHFTGTPLLNHRSCNMVKCGAKDSRVGSAQFLYYFPTWLLPFGVEVSGSWRDLSNFASTWSVKIPQVIISSVLTGQLLYIMQNGSVLELRKYMALNKVRAIDIDKSGWSLFEHAIEYAREDICMMLLENGTNLDTQNTRGQTLSELFNMKALYKRDVNRLYRLLQTIPQLRDGIESLKFNALHKIVLGLSTQDLAVHIELDPMLVHGRDCSGFTPLHWAVRVGTTHSCGLLLRAGADVNARCSEGRSVLSWAAQFASAEVCKIVLDAGAHIQQADHRGENALHRALRGNPINSEVITTLLEHDININLQSLHFKRTSLMLAVIYGTTEQCQTLLDHGAEIDARDSGGVSAIFHAVAMNKAASVRLISSRGATLNMLHHNGSSIISYVAWYGGIEIMRILGNLNIRGLKMDPGAMECIGKSLANETKFSEAKET